MIIKYQRNVTMNTQPHNWTLYNVTQILKIVNCTHIQCKIFYEGLLVFIFEVRASLAEPDALVWYEK